MDKIINSFLSEKFILKEFAHIFIEFEAVSLKNIFATVIIKAYFKENENNTVKEIDNIIKNITQNDDLESCYMSTLCSIASNNILKNYTLSQKLALCALKYFKENKNFIDIVGEKYYLLVQKNAEYAENNMELGNTIKIKTFGGFEVFVGDSDTPIKWRTKKAKEIFAYLFYMGNKMVKRDKILFEFWPDTDEKKAITLLHTNIYSIRNTLKNYGVENLINFKNQYYTFDINQVIADCDRLNALWENHCRGMENSFEDNLEIIENYNGYYMEDIDCEFCEGKRANFESIYLNLCKSFISHYISENQYQKAIPILNKAIKIDAFSSEFNYQLINIYIEIKDYSNALKAYKKYEKLCKEDFGVALDENLKDLIKNISNGDKL